MPVLVVALLGTALTWTLAGPASAADSTIRVSLTVPAQARTGSTVGVSAAVAETSGLAVSGADVVLERKTADGGWDPVGSAATGLNGAASFKPVVPAGGLTLRARFPGDALHDAGASDPAAVQAVVVSTKLGSFGTARVVDETAGSLVTRWTGSDGLPVVGTVGLWQHERNKKWHKVANLRTAADGRARIAIHPRVDMTYQFRGAAGAGWKATSSATWSVDNVPPTSPVVLPKGAPRPKALPAQKRAVGSGANPHVSTIPADIWKSMQGRSWHAGCPVGRSSLRYLQVNYWGFDGYRHRGELVVRAGAASRYVAAMSALYAKKVPIRAMYLPDRFGYSGQSAGANDYQSMRHDNTSAFNCRKVTGGNGERSPHSYGTSLDINPWENPYHSGVGWLPTKWWSTVQRGKYAWRSSSHLTVATMRAHGFSWTYGRSDPQHFDTRP